MSRKIFFVVGLLISIMFTFSMTFSFATDNNNDAMNAVNDVRDGVRNVVGGAEDAVEGAVKDVTKGVNDAGNSLKNDMNNVGNDINNGVNNVTDGANNNGTGNMNNSGNANSDTGNMSTTGNNGYTTSRTTAETRAINTNGDANTFLGMTSTMWTWLILALAAVIIVGLVWYYSNQVSNNRRYDNNGDE